MWSRPKVDKLLYLLIASLSFALENGGHSSWQHEGILSRSCKLIDVKVKDGRL